MVRMGDRTAPIRKSLSDVPTLVTKETQIFVGVTNLFNQRHYTYGSYFQLDGVAKAINFTFNDPRTITLAQPLAVYGEFRLKP